MSQPTAFLRFVAAAVAFVAWFGLPPQAVADETNAFPEVNEVLQGRAFTNEFDRDVFFLRQIRERYSGHWPALLGANITVGDYVISPEKMLRFVQEVGVAGDNSDDPIACTNLSAIICDADYYANTNASHPEIQEAAVSSLIRIGACGRGAVAGAFTEDRYRFDPASLETLADTIAKSEEAGSNFNVALAATAFTFTADNTGGFFPRCTEEATRCLLCLTNGAAAVLPHLNTNEVFANPGRFQSVVDGIAAARATSLAPRLKEMAVAIKARLATISPGPDPYRDDLSDLQNRVQRSLEQLRADK